MKNLHYAITPKIHYSFLKDARGHTLVETLVASAILLSVLIPATLILGRLTLGQQHHDLMVATQLAREEMERTIAAARYQDEEKLVALGKKSWRVVREVQEQSGLREIRIRVFKLRQAKPLVEIKTLRMPK
ncbi:MAG: type IV pilus modification PilV family protein [bacterium]